MFLTQLEQEVLGQPLRTFPLFLRDSLQSQSLLILQINPLFTCKAPLQNQAAPKPCCTAYWVCTSGFLSSASPDTTIYLCFLPNFTWGSGKSMNAQLHRLDSNFSSATCQPGGPNPDDGIITLPGRVCFVGQLSKIYMFRAITVAPGSE